MTTHGYEEIDHTADVAMRVRGEDLNSLLVHAAEGLYSIMRIDINSEQKYSIDFEVRCETQESMLIDFLNELLYYVEEKIIFTSFNFEKNEDYLIVKASGHPIEKAEYLIKAATFHDLRIKSIKTGLEATITFDV
jgi:SHS2 domain-containing protein